MIWTPIVDTPKSIFASLYDRPSIKEFDNRFHILSLAKYKRFELRERI